MQDLTNPVSLPSFYCITMYFSSLILLKNCLTFHTIGPSLMKPKNSIQCFQNHAIGRLPVPPNLINCDRFLILSSDGKT